MLMVPRFAAALLVVASLHALPAYADSASRASAANLANSCFFCHGPQGKSPDAVPPLTHHNAASISAALLGYKSGKRPATVMDRIAKGYTDEEIRILAAHIAHLNQTK